MTFSNYKYNLSSGSTFSYTKTTTQNSSAGSAGSASSGGSAMSQTVIVGNSSSASSASSAGSMSSVSVGSVGQLGFDTIVTQFTKGNLTVNEAINGLKAKGATLVSGSTYGDNRIITFKYQGKTYKICCNSAAAQSQVDSKTVTIFSKAQLAKIPATEISKYFIN